MGGRSFVVLKEAEMSLYEGKVGALIKSADAVVDQHSNLRVNGKVSSLRTQEYSKQLMRETCRRLHRLGYYLQDISGLSEKHIQAVVESWHREGKTPKTMQNQYSRLKIFCTWLGKPGIIDRSGVGVAAYLPGVEPETLKVKTYAEASKSWSGNGVDLVDMIKRATLIDKRLGAMLLLGVSFGLRKKEMLRIKPWRSDAGKALKIDGSVAKNGRARDLPIDENTAYGRFQRWCLEEAKSVCGKYQTLGWPELTMKQSENRYYHFLRRLGITKVDLGISGHGLRAEFAENMALIRGLTPPSLGGSVNQMPFADRKEITNSVSTMLGHDKEHTISAYFSTFRPVAKTDGIGGQVGPIIPLDLTKEIFISIWVNPMPIASPDGTYRKQTTSEIEQTSVTVRIDVPWQAEKRVPVDEFISDHPQLSEKIKKSLERVGFTDPLGESK